MKTIITLFIICASYLSHGQDLRLNAGSTISGIRHSNLEFTKQIGYFLGVSSQGDLEGPFSYSASLQFVNQHMSILDSDFNANAVNTAFYYGIDPLNKLTLLAGVQFGYIIQAKLEDTELEDFTREQFGWTAGVSFDVMERLEAQCRYIGAINEQMFDYTVQLGISFKLSN